MKKAALTFTLFFVLPGACAPPIETASTRLGKSSNVTVVNAPGGASLRIGNQIMPVGEKGTASLDVADGWHDVTVTLNGSVVLSRRVFIQDGSNKVIDFSAPY